MNEGTFYSSRIHLINKNVHIGIGPTATKQEDKYMNIHWLIFKGLVELVEHGGMHERVREFLEAIIESEIG